MAASQQGHQIIQRLYFIRAVGDQLNLHSLGNSHGQDAQKALGLARRSSFSTQMEQVCSLAFWTKNVAGLAYNPF